MRLGMKKPRALTVRSYVARLIDLNDYLASFPGATLNDNIGITKLNKILLNGISNSWYRQAYVKGFDCESITFNKAVNMLECMEIAKYIYKGVVEPSYKKPTREDATVLVTAVKREEKPHRRGLALRKVRALASAEKGM